jgi:hypothetical protein
VIAFIVSVVGVLLVIEGIPYFAFPKKAKFWASMLQEIPDRTLRVMGLAAMATGLALLYAVRAFLRQ